MIIPRAYMSPARVPLATIPAHLYPLPRLTRPTDDVLTGNLLCRLDNDAFSQFPRLLHKRPN